MLFTLANPFILFQVSRSEFTRYFAENSKPLAQHSGSVRMASGGTIVPIAAARVDAVADWREEGSRTIREFGHSPTRAASFQPIRNCCAYSQPIKNWCTYSRLITNCCTCTCQSNIVAYSRSQSDIVASIPSQSEIAAPISSQSEIVTPISSQSEVAVPIFPANHNLMRLFPTNQKLPEVGIVKWKSNALNCEF